VVGLDDQVNSFLSFEAGQFVTEGEPGIIITKDMAEKGGYQVDDTLTVTAANGESREVPIAGIFELPPMMAQGGPAGQDTIPSDAAAMYWTDLAALEGKSLEGEPVPQAYFLVSTMDDPTADEIDTLMEDINNTLLAQGIATQNFNVVEFLELFSSGFRVFRMILGVVASLIAVVGALGLLTTLSMSVFERQKEIGVMRSIGAGSSTVALQFLTEGLVVGIIAWVVGLPLAFFIEWILLEVTQFSDTFRLVYPVSGAIIGLIGVLVFAFFASILPSISAARKTVSDILRYQ